MTAEDYARWTTPLRRHLWAQRLFRGLNKALRWLFYLAFAVLLGWETAAATRGETSWQVPVITALVCGISFVLLSAVRAHINAPRPYEILAIDPLIVKDMQGKSFPSRHVFSCFAIASCWLVWRGPVGIALLAAGALVACIRVLGGVHWPHDVVAGALVGVACGTVTWLLLLLLG